VAKIQKKIYTHTLILNIINILIVKKFHYKTRLRKIGLAPNTPTSLQTTLVAAADLAEGRILFEGQKIKNNNNNNSISFIRVHVNSKYS
jgi:hypothetical protein